MGTEIGRLGGYGFRGTVTAGDGSNQQGGKMGAGYVNLRKKGKRQERKVGCEEEGSSSNRPELADAMNDIIVPLYHMRCHLAEVRIVHEGQFVSRIF